MANESPIEICDLAAATPEAYRGGPSMTLNLGLLFRMLMALRYLLIDPKLKQ